jgi:hypothetical protein
VEVVVEVALRGWNSELALGREGGGRREERGNSTNLDADETLEESDERSEEGAASEGADEGFQEGGLRTVSMAQG